MNKNPKIPEIRQSAFIQAREQLGFSISDLAAKACLSARQIEQIENGHTSSYYGAQNKFTAAKKVAAILKISDQDAFDGMETDQLESAVQSVPSEPSSSAQLAKKEKPALRVEKEITKKVESVKLSKRLILSLSICAGLVFAGINFYKNAFSEKTEEVQLASQDQAEPVATPTPEVNVPQAAESASEVCPIADAAVSIYKSESPLKPGDMVFVQSKAAQVVCVVDATGKTQSKALEQGARASFYGKPPFKVLTSGFNQIDLYFQGVKVRPDNVGGKTVLLEAVELVQAQPSNSTDSQFR